MLNNSYQYIDTIEQLIACCESLSHSQFLAIDTEFHREKTYYPELALIQVSDGKHTYIVDPLKLNDLSHFYNLIYNSAITKVLHSARQDYEIFFLHNGRLPAPVFDTQVAASLLGYGEQIGYAPLIKLLLDIDVDKSQTRTDWLKRPLNQNQLAYAAGDVIHLAEIYPIMLAELDKLGRLSWLDDDFEALTSAGTYTVDTRGLWKKLKSASRFSGLRLAIIQEICDWREQTAMQQNTIRKYILSDDSIADIANHKPQNIDQLRQLRGFNQRLNNQQLHEILDCISTAKSRPEENWPRHPKIIKPDQQQSAIIDVLSVIVALRASDNRISASFICNKKDLTHLVTNSSDSKLLTGWRKRLVGEDLLRFLDGQSAISITNNALTLSVL